MPGSFLLATLVKRFHAFNTLLVANGSRRPATAECHRYHLVKLRPADLGRPAEAFTVERLARYPAARNFLMSVQRLCSWVVQARLLKLSPVGRLAVPPVGQRERVLTEGEMSAILAHASPPYRFFWGVQRQTMARSQELRGLRWADVIEERRVIRLRDFKAKAKRGDGLKVRYLPLSRVAVRLLTRTRQERRPSPADLVFPNRWGHQLTCQAVRLAFSRTARRAKIDQSGERAVCYTIRHTAATQATGNGVRDRVLADILGHTNTATTARYQHLAAEDLVAVIDQATRRRRAG